MFSKLLSNLGSLWNRGNDMTSRDQPENAGVTGARNPAPENSEPEAAGHSHDAGPDPEVHPVLVHREILNGALEIQGMEYLIRGELHDKVATRRATQRKFLDSMLVDQLTSMPLSHQHKRGIWLQLGESSLFRLGIGRLPLQANILLLAEAPDRKAGQDLGTLIRTLRATGHQVWLDDALGTPWLDSLAQDVDGAILRMALRTPSESGDLLRRTCEVYPHLRLGAWDLVTQEDFELARHLECTHFSGSFVTRRENWTGHELTPQMLTVASLINQIRENPDFRSIASVLRRDIAMSYRLLRYVNVAAHGLSQPISSIEQGLMILGQEQLDRWLTLLLLSGGTMGDAALTEIALVRARFLELVGTYRLAPQQCDKLFVLGLFSMLDVALKVPLQTAIHPLNLEPHMVEALLSHSGPFGPYLALADACKEGHVADICKYAVMLGLSTSKVSIRQQEAINWVTEIAAHPATADPESATS